MKKPSGSFWLGLFIVWISHFFMDFMLGVWTVYKTIVQLDLVIAGLIAGVGIFIGEGLQLYFGYLTDRGYGQRLLTLGIGLTATIPFLSYVESEWLLLIMVLCAYIGSGAFHPSGSSLIMFEGFSHKSLFIALFACGGMVGAASSQIVYLFLYQQFDGHLWFLFLPIFFCVVSCALFAFPKPDQSKQQVNFKEVLKALKPQKFKLILLYSIHVLLQIVVMSFTFLLPDVLLIKGYTEWFCLGGGYFCFIMGSVLTSIPIGYCVDKVGYRLVLMTIVVVSTLFLYLFLKLETLSLTLPIMLLAILGGTLGVIIPVIVAGGIQNVPTHTRSFVSALYMGGTTCIGGLGPILTSFLASFFTEQAPIMALQLSSLLLILSLGGIYCLPDSFSAAPQEPHQVKMSSSLDGKML